MTGSKSQQDTRIDRVLMYVALGVVGFLALRVWSHESSIQCMQSDQRNLTEAVGEMKADLRTMRTDLKTLLQRIPAKP